MAELTFSECIAIKRKRARLSQSDLASVVGVSRNYVSQIERGHIENVSVKILREICQELDLEIQVVNKDGIGTHRIMSLMEEGHE